MKRPQSIAGLLITVLRIHAARLVVWKRVAAWAIVAALGLTIARSMSPCHRAVNAPAPRARESAAAAPPVTVVQRCARARSRRFSDCLAALGVAPRVIATLGDEKSLALSPVVAWNGDGYGVAWLVVDLENESFGVRFARLDRAGRRLGEVTRIADASQLAFAPDIVWNGTEYGLTWTTDEGPAITVTFARIGANGARIGDRLRLPDAASLELASRIAWNGREFALVWYSLTSRDMLDVRFRRVSRTGAKLESERRIERGIASGVAGFAWNGDGYGFAWNAFDIASNRATLRFVPLRLDGSPGRAIDVSTNDGVNGGAAMAWNGAAFGMAWEENLDGDRPSSLSFAAAVGADVPVRRAPITDGRQMSLQPALAWNGNHYGLAFADDSNAGIQVRFARVGRDGRLPAAPARITDRAESLFPTLGWTGTEFGCAWVDTRDGGLDVYFARLAPDGRKLDREVRISP